MAFLPRMRPRNFYDLVIEVAIVRPGPIQGDMVHPYIRRRNGEETVHYPSPELEAVLGKTMGVPLFQEQAMKIAIVAAGFTPGEADGLRHAMATFRRMGTIHTFRDKLVEGMVARGYERDFAERCYRQIEGFGDYGFPESHAASFALLVYVSAWLKCHYPDVFAAALLNSQPMGFYAPAQIARDAAAHAVPVRGPDVNASDWDYTLEPLDVDPPAYALRLGFRQIKGLKEEDGEHLIAARAGGFHTPRDVWRRAGIGAAALEKLAEADAFASMGLDRRQALWAIKALGEPPPPLFAAAERQRHSAPVRPAREPARPVREPALPDETPGEAMANDFAAIRMSLKHHPLHLLRPEMARRGAVVSEKLLHLPTNRGVTVAGLVLVRQRPGTAKGVIFATLEDETGVANIIIWARTFQRYRKMILAARLMLVRGQLQREGIVTHVIADHIVDLSARLDALAHGAGDGHHGYGPADEVKRPPAPDPRAFAHPRQAVVSIRSHDFH